MKIGSIKRNFVYNIMLNILNITYPLITAPYISRILGPNNLGIVNFATSVASWYVVVATFGISSYGIREIAKVRDNPKELNKTYTELNLINLIAVTIILGVYFTMIFKFPKFQQDLSLYYFYGLYIFLSVFSLEWFYSGIEQYEYIAKRSVLVKFISIICLFLFVKTTSDYIVYAIIIIGGLSFNSLFNFFNAKYYVRFCLKGINLSKHLRTVFVFFINALFASFFNIFDKIILGFTSGNIAVAFLTRNTQIISIGKILSTSLCNVLAPRLSNKYSTDKDYFNNMIIKSERYFFIIAIPCIIGIIVLAEPILYIMGGSEFVTAANTLRIMSFVILFTGVSSFISTQMAIPSGNEKITTIANFFVAIISLSINLGFSTQYSYYASAVALTFGELGGCIIHILMIRKKIIFKWISIDIVKILCSAIAMYGCSVLLIPLFNNYFAMILGVGSVSVIIYMASLLLLKETTTYEILKVFLK